MAEKREKLEKIREYIKNSDLSEEEKSNSFKHIEEWYAEDKAFGSLYEKLSEISPTIGAFLEDLGLV